MDDDAQVRRSVRGVFERMAGPVQWQDLRLAPQPRLLQGYLTRASGEAAPWEFRFAQPVPGLAAGALLWRAEQSQRWRVSAVLAPDDATPLWAARVQPLLEREGVPASDGVEALLAELQSHLERSTLAGLEREDAAEALLRLARLAIHPQPSDPAVKSRVAQRLQTLKALLGPCPQCGQAARGALLKLEALLRRQAAHPTED